jgi:hypothetical protein
MTSTERSARHYARKRKSINRQRRKRYKLAGESDAKKAKRERREGILADTAGRTAAASALARALLCNVIYLDPPTHHVNRSAETGSDRSTDNHYAHMSLAEIADLEKKLPAATDCIMY